MESSKWRSFFSYYKWHLIFLLLVIVCISFILGSVSTSYEVDLYIGYVGLESGFMKQQEFEDSKGDFEKLLKDATEDGARHSAINVVNVNKEKEALKILQQMIETEDYHIYIAPKDTFLKHPDKNNFAKLLEPDSNVERLTDDSGRIYAISLAGNTYIERLGLRDPSDFYIAAASFGKEELTDFEKNGINITNYIVESRKKFNK